MNMAQKHGSLPPRSSKEEIRQIAEFYDSLTEEEWIAHYEASYEQAGYTHLIVSTELMGTIGQLIAQAEHDRRAAGANDPAPTPERQPTPQESNFPSRLEPGTGAAPHRRDGRGRGKLDRGRRG